MAELKQIEKNSLQGSGQRITALVVDDDNYVRQLIRRLLEKHGHAVLEAADGMDAVDVFRREHKRINVVVMDVEMPRMNGIDAFRQMRNIQTDVPVIVISGSPLDGYQHCLPISDLAGVLLKPFKPEELLDTVAKCYLRKETLDFKNEPEAIASSAILSKAK